MTTIASNPDTATEAFWWQGSLMRIRARAEDTGGALGLVEGNFYEGFGPRCTSTIARTRGCSCSTARSASVRASGSS
jgi:hypothetical protein